jgi:spoIIIJ-associated protein
MQKKISIEATSEEEALKLSVEKLHISADKIFINDLGDNKYEALVDVDLALEGKRYLEGILSAIGLEYQIEVRRNGDDEINYVIESSENPLLIGIRGKTLESLSLLIKNLLGTYTKDKLIVSLDIGNYRANRIRQLEILATKTAKEVAKTKVDAKLRPMNSFERRVIHEKLSDWHDVYTESEGEGEERAIVIKAVKYEN